MELADKNAMDNTELSALDYFPSGVPPGALFKMSLEDLNILVKDSNDLNPLNITAELCFIGLASYFEAFCKNLFAAIINICPQTLNNIIKNKTDLNITIKELLDFDLDVSTKIGFIISEKCSFGSAKEINTLFSTLILLTPFDDNEKEKYDKFMADRNLLVHHAGIITHKYSKQHTKRVVVNEKRIFLDSLVIKKDDYYELEKFMDSIALKMCNNAYLRLTSEQEKNNWALNRGAFGAKEYLNMYDSDR